MRNSKRIGLTMALASAATGVWLLGTASTASAAQRVVRHRVVIVGPGPFFGPYWYPYNFYYPYPPYYGARDYGEVKIEAHHQQKNDDVYIDGGFAAKLKDHNKFAMKAGNHEIELRSPDGETIFDQRVAVTIGQTTKLHVS